MQNAAKQASAIVFSRPLLFVGNEPMLSKATAEVLKQAGYKVKTTNPLNVGHLIAESQFGAILLCATLSREEATEVARAVEQLQPGVPSVSIHLGLLGDGPPPNVSMMVDALNGPEALIGAVRAVTTHRVAS